MSIKIHLSEYIKTTAGNKDVVEVDGRTIRECLIDLERRYPGLKGEFFTKYDKLRNQIHIEVNVVRDLLAQVEKPNLEDKPVLNGDELYICVMACVLGGMDID